MKRALRVVATLVFTALAVGYLVWKIDLGTTADVLRETNFAWFALAVTIMIVTALPMALRWLWLLRAQAIEERFAWLTRAYFVSYAAGQVLGSCGPRQGRSGRDEQCGEDFHFYLSEAGYPAFFRDPAITRRVPLGRTHPLRTTGL